MFRGKSNTNSSVTLVLCLMLLYSYLLDYVPDFMEFQRDEVPLVDNVVLQSHIQHLKGQSSSVVPQSERVNEPDNVTFVQVLPHEEV